MNIEQTYGASFIDEQYRKWQSDPQSVSKDWQFYFQGFELGRLGGIEAEAAVTGDYSAPKQANVERLQYRYRDLGHLLACLDPLTVCPTSHPLLELDQFGLSNEDLGQTFSTRFGDMKKGTLQEIVSALKETYCRSIGIEYLHLQDPVERKWLQERMELSYNRPNLNRDEKIVILKRLHHAALFETLLNKKYPGQTRFSLEGAESLIPMLDALVVRAAEQGCSDIVFGMAHRGRLNVLVNILQKPYLEIFQEFANTYDPASIVGAGDVKYHNGYLSNVILPGNRNVRMLLVNNPSHLESVDPVVEGVCRGLQDKLPDARRNQVLPVVIHGDAAFAGQGVVTETLNLSQLDGYATQGTVHIIINNQIGYTTLPEHARSTRYSTDVAKMLMVPIFHIHGENPEALVHVVKLAYDYRQEFKKDVVIDLVCYRRHGHNEGDEPYFTQPEMYSRIKSRPSINKLYADQLIESGEVTKELVDEIVQETNQCLTDQFNEEQKTPRIFPKPRFFDDWNEFTGEYTHEPVKTAITKTELNRLAKGLNQIPENFVRHRKLDRILNQRLETVEKGQGIDWANAESLAFASLVSEGAKIRLSGQDSGRGTFSQRHAVIFDSQTGNSYTPINSQAKDEGEFEVYNSSLSEMAVVGFEYGYSIVRPRSLVLWEAQFGDFVNNAQSMIDLYIAAGQAKWQRLSGLVMLLPHGWEGLGPEHSSARLERFLQLCADDNMIVSYPSTPAQYFHLLRRQVLASYRKPLIVMTPKSLLRNPLAISNINQFTTNNFNEVLDDDQAGKTINRVILTSGKLYYELFQYRQTQELKDVAIVRLEQLYPFPETQLKSVLGKYKSAAEWIWVQEEPENMGAYVFVKPRLEKLLKKPIQYVGREEASSPATGFHNIYRQEQAAVASDAFKNEIKRAN